MCGFVWDEESVRYALRQARFWALELAEEFELSRVEREDDVSDLLLDACLRAKAYDATKGASQRTYIAGVILNEYYDLRKSHRCGKRARHRDAALLSNPAFDEERVAREMTDALGRPFSEGMNAGEKARDREIDIASQLSGVAENLRELAEWLRSDGVSEIARARGVSRSKVRREVKALRAAMERRPG